MNNNKRDNSIDLTLYIQKIVHSFFLEQNLLEVVHDMISRIPNPEF